MEYLRSKSVEVSVVIPTHERASLVGRAVHSVLAQRGFDLEVIVSIDGSTDETRNVLADIDDHRLRVVDSPVARGVAATRNAGVDAATGRWVALLDDDDL